MYERYFKRLLDFVMAAFVLLLTSPFFIITWIILFFQNDGKVFFKQQRPGLHEEPFIIVKFKTMNDKRDNAGNLLSDVERITPAGKLIRKLSLDELPQLFNVLKGEMSLIGPRPLLFKYIPLYSPDQKRRHDVRPGITGWAQVNGRNAISWSKRFELDLHYVDNLTLAMDAKIFYMTILKIIMREGVNQSDARPMQPFTGNN